MSRTDEELNLNLPFYVNGTLDADEAARVEAALAQDDVLKADAALLTALRDDMQAETHRSPGEFGLARLMRDVARDEAAPVSAPAAANSPVPIQSRTWVWQIAAAVAMALFVGQSLMLSRDQAAGGGGYELASAPAAPGLVVSFSPNATEAQIRGLLLDLGLEINGGPSALGLYRLGQAESENLDAEALALRGATGIVESVENAQN